MSSSCCCSLKPKLKSVVSLMELTNRGYQLARVHTNIVIHHRAPTNLHLSPWFTCRCLLIAAELVPLVGFSPPVFAPSMPGRRPSSRKGKAGKTNRKTHVRHSLTDIRIPLPLQAPSSFPRTSATRKTASASGPRSSAAPREILAPSTNVSTTTAAARTSRPLSQPAPRKRGCQWSPMCPHIHCKFACFTSLAFW